VRVIAFVAVAGHHLIAWIVIVAGALAGRIARGRGLLRDMIVGLIGAVIGGLILHAVRGGPHAALKLWQEIVAAVIGATVLLLFLRLATRSRGRSSLTARPAGWLVATGLIFGVLITVAPSGSAQTTAKRCTMRVDTDCEPAPCWILPIMSAPSRERCSRPR
jgi:uncharacterized membrane protein YeaQ/YmgE (transglycosylase-associated protein family)